MSPPSSSPGPRATSCSTPAIPPPRRLIMASIAKLGFDIKDVKVLLNSEPHPDHGGGLAVLQQASGAQLWASDASADSLAAGGDDPDGCPAVEGALLDRRPRLPAPARRSPVQGRRHDPCRADRAHRARHRRAYAWLHLVVVPGPRWRPRAECRERVRHGGAGQRRPIQNKQPTASAASACCGASPPTSG